MDDRFIELPSDDIVGLKKNRFIVISKVKDMLDKKHSIKYKCRCECDNIFYRSKRDIIKTINGCCPNCKIIRTDMLKHGLSNTRFDNIRHGMIQRCYNKNNLYYKNYGGRGIKVCTEWLNKNNGLITFYNWSIKNGYNDNLTLDRIDVNGDYGPSNCRWTTMKEQENNKRTNHFIKYRGCYKTIRQWCDYFGIRYSTLFYHYVKRHKSMDEIVCKYAIRNISKKGGDE